MSGYHDPLETGNNADVSVAHFYNRELADMADAMFLPDGRKSRYTDEEIAQHRKEWLANKKPEQPTADKEQQPMETKKTASERMYNIKTVAIVAAVSFILGWAAFWMFGNRAGRFQTVKYGNAAFILDTRTGEVSHLNGEKVTRKF